MQSGRCHPPPAMAFADIAKSFRRSFPVQLTRLCAVVDIEPCGSPLAGFHSCRMKTSNQARVFHAKRRDSPKNRTRLLLKPPSGRLRIAWVAVLPTQAP